METITTSFSSRRPAAGTLPAFSLPPPNAEIPRTTDGLSPSLSSVHTGGSQASQHHSSMQQYTFSGAPMQGSWNNNGSYQSQGQQGQPGQPPQQPHHQQQQQQQQQQPLPTSPYNRQPMYGHPSNMGFANPRSSQSPATGPDGLAAPPFDQTTQHYAPHDAHAAMTGAPHHPGLMATSSQPAAQPGLPAHSDAYAHTRPGSNPSYYASSGGHSQFSPYPPPQQPSPSQTSPGTGSPGARGGLASNGGMGYHRYGSYGQLPTMGGAVMSNMHQPGGQMSMIPGMSHHQGAYGGQMVYGHPAPQTPTERPFKCDQCVQSFSRNHDLKRHKRIHLAVKPFPCNYCSKSFSRKDALKRHRLVKGCETKTEVPDDMPRRSVDRDRV